MVTRTAQPESCTAGLACGRTQTQRTFNATVQQFTGTECRPESPAFTAVVRSRGLTGIAGVGNARYRNNAWQSATQPNQTIPVADPMSLARRGNEHRKRIAEQNSNNRTMVIVHAAVHPLRFRSRRLQFAPQLNHQYAYVRVACPSANKSVQRGRYSGKGTGGMGQVVMGTSERLFKPAEPLA